MCRLAIYWAVHLCSTCPSKQHNLVFLQRHLACFLQTHFWCIYIKQGMRKWQNPIRVVRLETDLLRNCTSCNFFICSHLPNMIRFQSDMHKNVDWQSEQGLSGVCLWEELMTSVRTMGNAWICVNDRAVCGVFSCFVWLSWTVFRCTDWYRYVGTVGIWVGMIYNPVSMLFMS